MGTRDLCRVPPAAVRHWRARQRSGTGPCVYCRKFLWVPDAWGQCSGKICFIEKPGFPVLKPRLPHGQGAVFGKKSFYRPSASCVYCCPVCPTGKGQYSGKNRFINKWAHETCAGCCQQRYVTGEPDKVLTVWGL